MTYEIKINEMDARNMRRTSSGAIGFSTIIVGIVGLALFCPTAGANCGSAGMAGNAISGKAFSLPEGPQADADSDQAPSSADEEHGAAYPSVVGFWKTTFLSGGTVFNVGYDQFHPDGLENSVDSPAPSTGNVCLGIWEKTGKRHYVVLHPAYNWDPVTGKVVSVYIQRMDFRVSRDGKTFEGTFTGDSYDFSGNFLAGSHVEGPLTGERITVKGRFPFPFPF